jgi:hypothetical protein
MIPSDIHFLLCEQHRHEMLAEAERRRLLRQRPRQPREGLRMVIAGLRQWIRQRKSRSARQVEAASFAWHRAALWQKRGAP